MQVPGRSAGYNTKCLDWSIMTKDVKYFRKWNSNLRDIVPHIGREDGH